MKNETIKKAIKQLKLTKKELNVISYGNIKKIAYLSNCDILDVMRYLRYNRD